MRVKTPVTVFERGPPRKNKSTGYDPEVKDHPGKRGFRGRRCALGMAWRTDEDQNA